jgi:hypothetical protein
MLRKMKVGDLTGEYVNLKALARASVRMLKIVCETHLLCEYG